MNVAAVLLSLALGASAAAQFKPAQPEDVKLGETKVQKVRIGVVVQAAGGACTGIVAHMAVPTNWPEQEVRIVDEEVSPSARVSYRMVDGMAQAMEVKIPLIPAGQEAKAVVTFEVRRSTTMSPEDTDAYVLPDLQKLDRNVRAFLAPSPKIESRDPRIRDLAEQIGADKAKAWERVEAIYDGVREKVKYQNGPLKGAVAALKDGTGDCEELTSLFIAVCRAANIPARTVWVEGHCYPEFYLQDKEGKGHWFPCQAAGTRSFGEIPEFRPILQKGDSIRPPHNPRDRQRYLADNLIGTGGTPKVKFIRQAVAD